MKPFSGWLNSFFFFLTGYWSIITGYVSQKWHCGASSCKEKEHGETHSCLWRNCHELLWWSYTWMSGSCRTCLWTCSGENFHYMSEIEWVEMFFLTCHQSRFKFCTGMNFFQALFPLLLKNSSLLQRSLSYSCHYHYCNIPLHKTIYFSQFYAVQYDLTVVFMYFFISLFLSSI